MLGFLLACACLFAVVARRTSGVVRPRGSARAARIGRIPLRVGSTPVRARRRLRCRRPPLPPAACRRRAPAAGRPRAGPRSRRRDGGPLLRRPRRRSDRRSPRQCARACGIGPTGPVVAAFLAPIVPLAVSVPLLREANRYAGAFWTEFDLGSAPEFFVLSPARRRLLVVAYPDLARHRLRDGGTGCGARRAPASPAVRADRGGRGRRLPPPPALRRSSSASSSPARTSSATCSPPSSGPRSSCRSRSTGSRAGARAQPSPRSVVLTLWFGVLFQYWHRDVGVDIDRRERLVAFVEEHAPSNADSRRRRCTRTTTSSSRTTRRAPSPARLIRLSDPERSLRYTGSRSTEDGLVVLAGFAPLRVVPYEEQRTPFLLLRTVRGEARDWIDPRARRRRRTPRRRRATTTTDGFELVRVEPAPLP